MKKFVNLKTNAIIYHPKLFLGEIQQLISGFGSSGTRSGSFSSHSSLFLQGFDVFRIGSVGFLTVLNSSFSINILPSKSGMGNQSLNFWGLEEFFTVLILGLSSNDISGNVPSINFNLFGILSLHKVIGVFGQIEHSSNFISPLWSQSSWWVSIGKTFKFGISLLDNDQGKNSNISTNDATSNGLPSMGTVLVANKTDRLWLEDKSDSSLN